MVARSDVMLGARDCGRDTGDDEVGPKCGSVSSGSPQRAKRSSRGVEKKDRDALRDREWSLVHNAVKTTKR